MPGRLAVFSLILMMLSFNILAEARPVIVNYSQLTETFDGQLPIGARFQIKGRIGQHIQGVLLESFGFGGEIPEELKSRAGPLYEGALQNARNKQHYTKLSWSRPQPESASPMAEFVINHPRLYYGRNYMFAFTFYQELNNTELRRVLKRRLGPIIKSISNEKANFMNIFENGLIGDKFTAEVIEQANKELEEHLANLSSGEPDNALINRNNMRPSDLFEKEIKGRARDAISQNLKDKMFEILIRIAADATLEKANKEIGESRDSFDGAFETVLGILLESSDKIKAELQIKKRRLLNAIDSRDWEATNGAAESFILFLVDLRKKPEAANGSGEIIALSALLAKISTDASALSQVEQPGLEFNIDRLVANIVKEIPEKEIKTVISSTFTRPYLETMAEQHPFLISLNGGLIYVSKFEEVVPTIVVNIKINRTDFDDPFTRGPEFSVLVGLGMKTPDDLDPDYHGIFGRTGDRSLLLGLGIRHPRFSPLIMFQAGGLLYKQESRNPLEKDFSTEASFFVGASVNWDTLDFAAKLFSDRPNFDIGGL